MSFSSAAPTRSRGGGRLQSELPSPTTPGYQAPSPAYDIIIDLNQMCKHILNVQAAIRSPCCKKWFDCSDCHDEASDHPLKKTTEMVMACKLCKKVFRKDILLFEQADEFCPHCDNKYVLDAVMKEDR